MTSTAAGQEGRRYDCRTPGWFAMSIAGHKHEVLVSKVSNLASGYEPALEELFRVAEPAEERKDIKPPNKY